MKRNLTQWSAAGALLALSSTAFADITQSQVNAAQGTAADTISGALPGATTATAFSGLIFFAYNPDGSFSQVQTLGIRGSLSTSTSLGVFSNVQTNDGGTTLTFSLDNGGAGGLLNANSGTLRWGIVSFDDTGDSEVGNSLGLLSTVNTTTSNLTATGVLPTTATINGTGGVIRNFLTANPSSDDSLTSTSPNAINNWTTDNLNSLQLTGSISATGSASSTLAMYAFGNAASSNVGATAGATQLAGTWSFDAVAGTVTYAVSAVPVPAAVWLLLSGLGGIGVVGRRRRAVAAA